MKTVRIDVVSDTVCPWCYVGKRRMEAALKKYEGKVNFQVLWHPYQINPEASLTGVNKLQTYKEKFGEQRIAQMLPAMRENFEGAGLPEPLYGGLVGNTFDSHRLIWWAGQKGEAVQDKVVEELMLNYFCQEKFINDRTVLVAAAEKAGLQGSREFLESDGGKVEVRSEIVQFGKKNNVSGVPFYIVDGRASLSGAQPTEQWEAVLNKLLATAA